MRKEITKIIQENFTGEDVTPQDICIQIPLPQDNENCWVIETEDGKEIFETLTGVIFHIDDMKLENSQQKCIYIVIPELSEILPCQMTVGTNSFEAIKKLRLSSVKSGIRYWDSEVQLSLSTSALQIKQTRNIEKTAPEYHSKVLALREEYLPFIIN